MRQEINNLSKKKEGEDKEQEKEGEKAKKDTIPEFSIIVDKLPLITERIKESLRLYLYSIQKSGKPKNRKIEKSKIEWRNHFDE